jgi:hypothetical protein
MGSFAGFLLYLNSTLMAVARSVLAETHAFAITRHWVSQVAS